MSTVKRPRIEPWIAERIDQIRDGEPFERWVNAALDTAAGRLWIEPDPAAARMFTLLGDEGLVLAHGLTRREAEDMAALVRSAHAATSYLMALSEDASAIGASKVYEWAEATMRELDDLLVAITARDT